MLIKANELNSNLCDKDGFINKSLSLDGLEKSNLANQFYNKVIQIDADAQIYNKAIRLNCNYGGVYKLFAAL